MGKDIIYLIQYTYRVYISLPRTPPHNEAPPALREPLHRVPPAGPPHCLLLHHTPSVCCLGRLQGGTNSQAVGEATGESSGEKELPRRHASLYCRMVPKH